jgi:hypothetical protein
MTLQLTEHRLLRVYTALVKVDKQESRRKI